MNIRRAIVSAVFAAQLALVPTAPSLAAAPVQAQSDCKHAKIGQLAAKTFRYDDGTTPYEEAQPSLPSEWRILESHTLVHQGPPLFGRMPQGFYGLNDENFAFYEGAMLSTTGSMTLACIPSPGTKHVDFMPQRCPKFADEAVEQIGGVFPENWREEDKTYSTVLHYVGLPETHPGPFTAPFQGIVTVESEPGVTTSYPSGYLVPASEKLQIECSKAIASFVPPPPPAPVAP